VDTSEELSLPPSRWYLTGFLAPEAGREEDDEAQEELTVGNDETEEETGGTAPDPRKKNFLPASIGLTVFVPAGATHVEATVRYATYDKLDRVDVHVPTDPGSIPRRVRRRPGGVSCCNAGWRRRESKNRRAKICTLAMSLVFPVQAIEIPGVSLWSAGRRGST
jgi:hypothetical protein